jgi:DNA polymerase
MAGTIYGIADWQALDKDSNERFVGKVTELGLGYQMGAPKFRDTLALGTMGKPVFLEEWQSQDIVYNKYRPTHAAIVNQWREVQELLPLLMEKNTKYTWKVFELRHNMVILPNGMPLLYSGLRWGDDGRSIEYWADQVWNNIYGGLGVENFVQALARIKVSDAAREVDKEFPVVMHTHDEIVALAPESRAEEAVELIHQELIRPPSWAPDIPLDSEGGFDYCYSK